MAGERNQCLSRGKKRGEGKGERQIKTFVEYEISINGKRGNGSFITSGTNDKQFNSFFTKLSL